MGRAFLTASVSTGCKFYGYCVDEHIKLWIDDQAWADRVGVTTL